MLFDGIDKDEPQQVENGGAKTDPALIAWMFKKSGVRLKG